MSMAIFEQKISKIKFRQASSYFKYPGSVHSLSLTRRVHSVASSIILGSELRQEFMEKVLSFLNHKEVLKEKQDKKQTSNKNKIKMLKIFADLMSVYSCWIIMIASAARDEY